MSAPSSMGRTIQLLLAVNHSQSALADPSGSAFIIRTGVRLEGGIEMIGEEELTGLSTERLEREIAELGGHINAATARWLGLVGEYDHREGWAEWGCRSCTHWLSYRCGVSPAAAREQVRVARRLAELPHLQAAFARGELCYSQVRAVTRVATPDTEADLLEIALHATASQLETIVRAYRGVLEVELGDGAEEHRRRFVRCEHDEDGALLIHARLPAEEGALVLKALEASREALRAGRGAPGDGGASAETTHIGDAAPGAEEEEQARDPETIERFTPTNADALVLMAHAAIEHGPAEGGGEHQVVVHVDAATLAHDEDGACELEQGPALAPETARRLGCDASVVRILERDGRPLSIGRKTRTLSPALKRALRSRDRTCRFPGCDQQRFLHAHHIQHWAQGGRTDLSNLIQLCSHHHRLVHEGGYGVERGGGGRVRFRRPDGEAVPAAPRAPQGEAAAVPRLNGTAGVAVDDTTCVPCVHSQRMQLPWIVDGLAEADPRLRALDAPPEGVREPEGGGGERPAPTVQAA
jgi:hypothetical protein